MNRRVLTVGVDGPAPLKAITILQPFASAIMSTHPKAKRAENRGWTRAWPAGGTWVAIHSGKRPYPVKGPSGWVELLDHLTDVTGWDAYRMPGCATTSYLRSAILGLARFVDCVPVQTRIGDPWAVGPWCHVIDEVRLLDRPIPNVVGSLGFWTVPDEHLPPLRALLEGA